VELADLKAPQLIQGIPPWQDPQWLADTEAWIDAQCARAALTRTGPARARCRPYSVVASVPTDQGTVWFKASAPMAGFEPALIAALATWYPDHFATPIAVDLDRAWSLTRDGGPTLRDELRDQLRDQLGDQLAGREDTSAWHATIRGYAELQADLTRHVDDLRAIGLPDLRLASVPAQYGRLLADPALHKVLDTPDGITRDQYQALHQLSPQLAEWCAELDELGIPASLDHADVHPGNIFAATSMPFDWGDAAVAHPFASLLVLLRTAAQQAGLPANAAEITALTEAYLQPWLEAGHPRRAVDRALPLALRVSPLARALTWGRLFPCYLGHPGPSASRARTLAGMLDANPLGTPR
jgi:hypothetical protein